MAANYLHGVETIEVEKGKRPVRTVKSAVIGLIGTAPIGAVNVATLTLSEKFLGETAGLWQYAVDVASEAMLVEDADVHTESPLIDITFEEKP